MELNAKPFSLLRVMFASLQMQRARAVERGVGLYLEMCDSVPFAVTADELRIKQCMINYLSCVQRRLRVKGWDRGMPGWLCGGWRVAAALWRGPPLPAIALTSSPRQQRAQVYQGRRRPATRPPLPAGA